jgi:hypothetical protein
MALKNTDRTPSRKTLYNSARFSNARLRDRAKSSLRNFMHAPLVSGSEERLSTGAADEVATIILCTLALRASTGSEL